jgi:hypothetical protein
LHFGVERLDSRRVRRPLARQPKLAALRQKPFVLHRAGSPGCPNRPTIDQALEEHPMRASTLLKMICTLALTACVAACGGGGSDVNVQVPTASPSPTPTPSPDEAWPVSNYAYWIARDDPNALGNTAVAPDRSFNVSNIAVKFSAPYTAGCSINSGLCVERLAARAVVVCPQNQPNIALVDKRFAKITDLTALHGTTYRAVFDCDDSTAATAAVSASGAITVTTDTAFPLGPLADHVASGRFTVRRFNTASGPRHVIVERRTSGFIALFIQD